ncbi:unnamed protein product [Pleuronectes platessa]|uniref:Uncharacterized protein n=1 Tax=Pleuronectes platessa TaxID=8262 RepID=A0A9N7Z3W3_PLEPL|nr:unnamed protein product [Pleuronectes platessa]
MSVSLTAASIIVIRGYISVGPKVSPEEAGIVNVSLRCLEPSSNDVHHGCLLTERIFFPLNGPFAASSVPGTLVLYWFHLELVPQPGELKAPAGSPGRACVCRLVLVTSEMHDDIVLQRGRRCLFHRCGCTLQAGGKAAADSFMDPCEGSLQTEWSRGEKLQYLDYQAPELYSCLVSVHQQGCLRNIEEEEDLWRCSGGEDNPEEEEEEEEEEQQEGGVIILSTSHERLLHNVLSHSRGNRLNMQRNDIRTCHIPSPPRPPVPLAPPPRHITQPHLSTEEFPEAREGVVGKMSDKVQLEFTECRAALRERAAGCSLRPDEEDEEDAPVLRGAAPGESV